MGGFIGAMLQGNPALRQLKERGQARATGGDTNGSTMTTPRKGFLRRPEGQPLTKRKGLWGGAVGALGPVRKLTGR